MASVALGVASLVATAPAWATAFGIAGVALGVTALAIEFSGVPNPEFEIHTVCACGPPPGQDVPAGPGGRSVPSGASSRSLEIRVEPGSLSLDWSFGLSVALHLGGLML